MRLRMSNFSLTNLGAIADGFGGAGFPEPLQGNTTGEIPFIKVSDFNLPENKKYIQKANNYISKILADNHKFRIFPSNTIVIAKVGAAVYLNRKRILTQNTIIDNNMMGIITKIDHEFLYQSLLNVDFTEKVQQGALPSLTFNLLSNIKLYIPDLPTQKRIAKILSTVDGQIEKTEAIIAKYQAIKQGMLHDLFTRGIDLATGKLRPPPEQSPELYKPSPLGLIPKAWDIDELAKCCNSNGEYGINAAAVDYSNELPTYLRITDISENGEFINTDKKSVNNPLSNNYILSFGDIVFARTGASVGKTYLYNPDDGKLIYAGFLIKFSPREDKLLPKFLKLITELPHYKNWVTKTSMRSGQPGINGQEYGSLIVQLPDIKEQSLICSKINSLENLLTIESSQLTKLQKLKQGLMSKLLNGDV